MLRLYLQMRAGDRYVIADPTGADLAIFDFDTDRKEEKWAVFRARFPELPTITIAHSPPLASGIMHLQKPLTGSKLLEALGRATAVAATTAAPASIPATPSGTTRNPSSQARDAHRTNGPAAPSTGSGLRLSGSRVAASALGNTRSKFRHWSLDDVGGDSIEFTNSLALLLKEALAAVSKDGQARMIRSRLQQGQSLVVTAERGGAVRTRIANFTLRRMSLVSGEEQGLTLSPVAVGLNLAAYGEPRDGGNTLWDIAVWTARGRRPTNVGMHDLVHMHRWPNLTRVTLPPHAVRIAALWARGTFSVADTARILGIDVAPIYSCLYAMDTCGLVRITPIADGNAEPNAPAPTKASADAQALQRGFFSKIITHLFSKS